MDPRIPFVDTHQHCLLSSDAAVLREQGIVLPVANIHTLSDITRYAKSVINPLLSDLSIVNKLIFSAFTTSVRDNVKLVCTSIDYTLAKNFGTIEKFLTTLSELSHLVCGDLTVEYDLGISRDNFDEAHLNSICALLSSGVFSGVDLYGNEHLGNEARYAIIFRYARQCGLLRKAHVGEFRRGIEILAVAKTLDLNEVQHGITIVDDPKLVREAHDRELIFNVCPTSNRTLKQIEYADHPIKQMLGEGLRVTLGTDDRMFFLSSVGDEYANLINAGTIGPTDAADLQRFTATYKLANSAHYRNKSFT